MSQKTNKKPKMIWPTQTVDGVGIHLYNFTDNLRNILLYNCERLTKVEEVYSIDAHAGFPLLVDKSIVFSGFQYQLCKDQKAIKHLFKISGAKKLLPKKGAQVNFPLQFNLGKGHFGDNGFVVDEKGKRYQTMAEVIVTGHGINGGIKYKLSVLFFPPEQKYNKKDIIEFISSKVHKLLRVV